MKRRGSLRLPLELVLIIVGAGALVLSPHVAFAQHGGGGHMGGGGHFGGGFGGHASASSASHSHSGGFWHWHSSSKTSENSSSPVVGAGTSHSAFVQPPSESNQVSSANGSKPFTPLPAHTTIGFPDDGSSTILAGTRLKLGPSAGPLSFSGEGHQIWQNDPPILESHLFTSSSLTTRLHPPHRVHPPTVFAPRYPATYFPVFGYGFGPFFGFNGGCDPFDWYGFACNYLGYGYGPGYSYGYGGYYSPDDFGAPAGSDDASSEANPSSWQNPPQDEDSADTVEPSIPHTVIYLLDGSSYEVIDFWLTDKKLHYVTNYGGENAVDIGEVDMQRTVDANAARGVGFTLHPGPPPAQLTPPASEDSARP